MSESGFAGLWDFQDSSRRARLQSHPVIPAKAGIQRAALVCQNQDLLDYRIFRILPAARVFNLTPSFPRKRESRGRRIFVRIRICGIIGFSGFFPPRASLMGELSRVFGLARFSVMAKSTIWGKTPRRSTLQNRAKSSSATAPISPNSSAPSSRAADMALNRRKASLSVLASRNAVSTSSLKRLARLLMKAS